MNYVKRWTSGIFSCIDGLVTKVENHDALANAALRDLQQATARAQIQLKRVREDGETLRRRFCEERESARQWRQRAKQVEAEEQRAIECLRRSKRADRLADEIQRRIETHERAEQQLAKDVSTLKERYSRLKEQRNLMRTRQTRAEAFGSVGSGRVEFEADIEEIFDRWETRVAEDELTGGCSLDVQDALEHEFASAEEEAMLRAELDELRKENGHD